MKTDINKDKIIQSIRDFYRNDNALQYYLDRNKANILLDYITNLQQENKQLKELQRKIDVLTYIIKHLDYLDIWNEYNTSELEEIIKGEENEQ